MDKICKCGSDMDITLRTLFFNKKIEIKNVPFFSCYVCGNNELLLQFKIKIKNLVKELANKEEKQVIYFDNICQLAQLIVIVFNKQKYPSKDDSIEAEIEELINAILLAEVESDSDYKITTIKKIDKLVH